jgi:serine/threonine-protein kinase RsbW
MPTAVFEARFTNLAKIARFVRNAALQAGFDDKATYQVETAVDEACSNIIEHAYGGESSNQIECNCEILSDRIEITLIDNGLPFNPEDVPAPNTKASLKERENHGLGLFFMRQWMDEVYFSCSPDRRNCVTMVKNKESSA